jgi:hypothetical protein
MCSDSIVSKRRKHALMTEHFGNCLAALIAQLECALHKVGVNQRWNKERNDAMMYIRDCLRYSIVVDNICVWYLHNDVCDFYVCIGNAL